jgi:hypothetical protein
MSLDGPLADTEGIGDLLVWIAFDDHFHDLTFARGQAGDPPRSRLALACISHTPRHVRGDCRDTSYGAPRECEKCGLGRKRAEFRVSSKARSMLTISSSY